MSLSDGAEAGPSDVNENASLHTDSNDNLNADEVGEPSTSTGVKITTSRSMKPRKQCTGGSQQLKLGKRTKEPITEAEKMERAVARVKTKIGETLSSEMLQKWKDIQKIKDKKRRQAEGDGVIKTLKSLAFSNIEIRAFLRVGSNRISRIMSNKPKLPPKPPKHAVTDEDTARLVKFVLLLDLEPGYPCSHRNIPLYIEGSDQGSTWVKLHDKYETMCKSDGASVRVLSYNRFREYVHHFFPTLRLGRLKTDICNECFKLKLKQSDPEISDEEKKELKQKLETHVGEGAVQRRAMNAYIFSVKNRVAPNDPPLDEVLTTDDVNDVILQEALNAHAVNPVLLDIDNLENCIENIYPELNDEIDFEDNGSTSDNETNDYEKVDEIKDACEKVVEIQDDCEKVVEIQGDCEKVVEIQDDCEKVVEIQDDCEKAVEIQFECEKAAEIHDNCEEAIEIQDDEKEDDIYNEKRNKELGEEQTHEESQTNKLTQRAKKILEAELAKRSDKEEISKGISPAVKRSLHVTIEDYGSEKPLPHYGINRPNADYFNSSIHLRNMNIIDPSATGKSSIYIYDERTAGKDGNSVGSVRWFDLVKKVTKSVQQKSSHPQHHVGIYDNCVGQNKSNTVLKFELMLVTLGFFETKSKLFLLPGHSHNMSDVKTAEFNKCLVKKNIYTAQQMCNELEQMKDCEPFLLTSENFYVWEEVLDRHIKNLPSAFTSFYCFEISEGTIAMKRLCSDNDDDSIVTAVLIEDLDGTKASLLEELFGLPHDATIEDIVKTPLKLPILDIKKSISKERLKSIKQKYQVIPPEHLWYYPESEKQVQERGDAGGEESSDDVMEKIKKKAGRPPKASLPVKRPASQPSIAKFFKAFPLPSTVSKAASDSADISLSNASSTITEENEITVLKNAASPENPAPATAPVAAAPKKDYNEARLQIRQSNGQPLVHTFGAKEPLSAVRLYVQMNRTDAADGQVKLMTNFPKKIFADDEYDNTLENLGLTPSAVLIVTK